MCGNGHERCGTMDEETKLEKASCVARSSLNQDSALEFGRCPLSVQCSLQVHIFEGLVSNWWRCLGRVALQNL